MSPFRLALAGALVAGAVLPMTAQALPPTPTCKVTWEPFLQTSPNLPPLTVYRPVVQCYGGA